jgi:hypothetical protein
MENQEKELDLLDLLKLFANWCNNVIKWMLKKLLLFIRFNIKNWIIVLCCLIVGLAISVYKLKPENRKHSAEFILEVKGSSSFIMKDMIDVLAEMREENTEKSLGNFSSILGLTEEEAKKIYKMGAFYVVDLNKNGTVDYVDYDGEFKEDSVNVRMDELVDVLIKVRGELDYNRLQTNLINYLNSDPDLLIGRKTWQKKMTNMSSALNVEITTLDSMRNAQIKKIGSGLTKADYSGDKTLITQSSYYEDMIALKSERMKIQEELENTPTAVMAHTKVRSKNVDKNGFIYFKWVGFFYVFGLFMTLLIRKRKKIVAFVKEQKEN